MANVSLIDGHIDEKRFTDEEIIKVLECCYGDINENCEECPNKNTCGDIDVVQITVNRINRQKAEIERLQKENSMTHKLLKDARERIEELDNLNGTQKEEIERLQSINQAKLDTIHDLMAEVERLKPFEKSVKKIVKEEMIGE